MKDFPDILNQAIKQLKGRKSFQEVLDMPDFKGLEKEQKAELKYLLPIALELSSLESPEIPTPAKRRKYISAPLPVAGKILFFHLPRLAFLSAIFAAVLSAGVGTGYAAFSSLPGDTLFTVKKQAEQLQLKFTASPEKKASLQVSFAKKRLKETRRILNSENPKPGQIQAAVQELNSQAESAAASAETAAISFPSSEKTTEIIASLSDISLEQRELAGEINPQSDPSLAKTVKDAAEENSQKAEALKEMIKASQPATGLVDLKPENESPKNGDLTDKPLGGAENSEVKGIANVSTTSPAGSSFKPSQTTTPISLAEEISAAGLLNDPTEISAGFIVEDPLPQMKK